MAAFHPNLPSSFDAVPANGTTAPGGLGTFRAATRSGALIALMRRTLSVEVYACHRSGSVTVRFFILDPRKQRGRRRLRGRNTSTLAFGN